MKSQKLEGILKQVQDDGPQNVEISFDQMRQEISVHFNELARVMNSHQEQCFNGSGRVEIDSLEAQQLMHNLRGAMTKLMAMECKEHGITSSGIKLSRMIVSPINYVELCRA